MFDIEYEVDEAALPLESVHLWYRLDQGGAWQSYGFDEDRQSPMRFHAPSEGRYDFFLVLRNAAGASSAAPDGAATPMLSAFVDFTPPTVQLHPPRETTMVGERVLRIEWTALDDHLLPRPIELTYRSAGEVEWQAVASDPLSNTGQYDWRLPSSLVGPIALRLTASDRGGHRATADLRTVEIASRGDVSESPAEVRPAALQPTPLEARSRAARLYAEGIACRNRLDYREGIARMREAARLDPQRADAFAEIADMLFLLGDFDRAEEAYQLALRIQPALRSALLGSAMIHRAKGKYATAAERLRAILRSRPSDGEAWLQLGDVASLQGEEILARDYYQRAVRSDPDNEPIAANARQRLAMMEQEARAFRDQGR